MYFTKKMLFIGFTISPEKTKNNPVKVAEKMEEVFVKVNNLGETDRFDTK